MPKLAEKDIKQSNERANDISENIMDAFYAIDDEWRFTYLNRQAELLFGQKREELIGKVVWREFPGAIDSNLYKQFQKAAEERVIVTFEEFYSVVETWFEVRIVPSTSELSVYLRNINERKQAEETLRERENLYRTFFNSMDQGFCLCKVLFDEENKPLDYRFLEVNPVFEKMTGIPNDKAISEKTARELVPNLEEKWVEIYGRVALTGVSVHFTEGSQAMNRYFDVYTFRVGDAENRTVAIFFNDITDHKQSELALKESENKYRMLVEQASDGIHTYDFNGNFIETNSKLCEMLGYTAEELLQQKVQDLVPAEELVANPIRFDELRSGKTLLKERNLLRKDGTLIPVEISGKMIQDGLLQGIVRDISGRKSAEELLKQSEERLRSIFEAAHDGILVENDEIITYVNKSYLRTFGYEKPEELIGQHISVVVSPEDAERVIEFGRNRLDSNHSAPSKYEFRGRRRDGSLVDVEASVSTSNVAGRIYITTMLSDITDRKRAQEALLSSEKQLRLITDAIPLLISFVDKDQRYRFVNKAYTEWFGRSRGAVIGKRLPEVLGETAYKALLPEVERALSGEEVFFERLIPYKNGERFIQVNYIPEVDGLTGATTGFYAFVQDVSESKKAEELLRRSHKELEDRVIERTGELEKANKALQLEIAERRYAEKQRIQVLQQLVTIQEDERQRLARDLHDELGQQLTALRLRLEMLKKTCGGNEELRRQISEIQKAARELDEGVDFLAWQMRPAVLDDLGIIAALDHFIRQWSTHFNIPAMFSADRFGKFRLSGEAETNLYRIVQEALNNISKHAQANKVNVFLEPRDKSAVLIIEDDGVGFDIAELTTLGNGIGLIGMNERAALVSGTFEVESAKGTGTTIYVKIPITIDHRENNNE